MSRWMAVFGALAVTVSAAADKAGADLCGFEVEGLTIASSHAEVAAVFGPRGWHDLSRSLAPARNQDVIIFDKDRATDDMLAAQADPDGPLGRLTVTRLITANGPKPSGIGYIYAATSSPVDTARALCARFSGPKYYSSGCRFSPAQSAIALTFEPLKPSTSGWCQVGYSASLTPSPIGHRISIGVQRSHMLPERVLKTLSAEERMAAIEAARKAGAEGAPARGGGRAGAGGRGTQPPRQQRP
ncbi:MAG: hypothetical protein R3E77_00610 [Steroidobacteraceae bacterium]